MNLAPAAALAGRYQLALAVRPLRGLPGDNLSNGVGSSVEFQDFRPYVPGDDLRHIDWAAVARTDQLIVRLHRADVRLSFDILLDTSRSLGLAGGLKAERAAQLACLLALLGRKSGARVTLWAMGDDVIPLREDLEPRLERLAFEGRTPMAQRLEANPPPLETGSLRFVISDFLFPHDPLKLASAVARGAAGGAFLQLLGREEQNPPAGGHMRLRDVETGEERQMVLSAETVGRYRERLRRLQEGLSASCRGARLPFALLEADLPLEELCRGPLLRAEILEPA